MCSSGDKTLSNTEKSQADFTNTLHDAFKSQFGARKGTLDFLTGTLTDSVKNPQGMTPEALAAARTQATQQTAGDFDNAQKAVQGKFAARGGSSLPSGVDEQVLGSLAGAGATEQSNAQNNITLENERQRQQNYWNSVSGLQNVAQQEDPNGLASNATNAADSTATLGSAYKSSQSSQLLGVLGSIAGGAGTALGGYLGKP
jgi:hypothetical protein